MRAHGDVPLGVAHMIHISARSSLARKYARFYGAPWGLTYLGICEELLEFITPVIASPLRRITDFLQNVCRTSKASERPIKIRTCENRGWCSLSPCPSLSAFCPRFSLSLSRMFFFPEWSFQSRVAFFYDGAFRKLRYCTWWIWKKNVQPVQRVLAVHQSI